MRIIATSTAAAPASSGRGPRRRHVQTVRTGTATTASSFVAMARPSDAPACTARPFSAATIAATTHSESSASNCPQAAAFTKSGGDKATRSAATRAARGPNGRRRPIAHSGTCASHARMFGSFRRTIAAPLVGPAARASARALHQGQQVGHDRRVVAVVGVEVRQVDGPGLPAPRGARPVQEAIDDVVVVEDERRDEEGQHERAGRGQPELGQGQRLGRGARRRAGQELPASLPRSFGSDQSHYFYCTEA